jgi:peptidoglycan hydrolase-like protein with peptidoglycan-binding domain
MSKSSRDRIWPEVAPRPLARVRLATWSRVSARPAGSAARWPVPASLLTAMALLGVSAPAGAAATAPPLPGASASVSRAAPSHLSVVQAIRVLQRTLGLRADGVFGPRTDAAVRAAQRRHRLPPSGVVGPATWRALGLPVLRTLRMAPARARPPVALTPASTPTPAPNAASPAAAGYVNPFAGVAVTPERIDMGVDYAAAPGTPIRALGGAKVVTAKSSNSGWPGGGLVSYQLNSGPYAGDCVYVAEDVVPAVQAGQAVLPGTVIAYFKAGQAGIETGWGLADGQTLASALHEDAKGLADRSHDPGLYSTGAGVHFALLLAGLGAPPGLLSPGGIQGPIAAQG